MATSKKLKITLKKSLIGVPEKQIKVLRALGLRKREHTVIQDDNPVINGMIFKVSHMVDVERVKK
jgi:large subunit ribosomal protein L30